MRTLKARLLRGQPLDGPDVAIGDRCVQWRLHIVVERSNRRSTRNCRTWQKPTG